MRPEVPKVLEILAGTLLVDVAPHVSPSYRQSSLGISALLLGMIREEFDRAASRRSLENAALRTLFRDATPALADTDLRRRLETASASTQASLLVSDLERENDALRALLIELHAQVEQQTGPEARRIENSIWRELVASTERRKLSLAPF